MKLPRPLRRWLGSHGQRELAEAEAELARIRRAQAALASLPDDELRARGASLRARARAGEALDSLLVETFAVAAEAARRALGLSPFDVQLVGGIALHRGNIAEMKTGEGKTLVATFPAALNALVGKGVHIVTVNDYLAERDAAWMRPVYEFFGLSVGVVTETMDPESARDARRRAYAADVTYVTNHELVFDYLRDNLATSPDEVVGRGRAFALVDEADFLLLDEARTPLIISGPSGHDPEHCERARDVVAKLEEGRHFERDSKIRQVTLTEAGYRAVEKALGIGSLADPDEAEWRLAIHNALLARGMYERDVDYIVRDGEVQLVDEFTGRLSPDKRLENGLHQAIEAKERVEVLSEDVTIAKVSYQSYFRLYPKLAGMTGTAWAERDELSTIYGLGVVRIPTNRPVIRRDLPDRVFRTEGEKLEAVADHAVELASAGRAVLVGTVAIREAEKLAKILDRRKAAYRLLTAKNDAEEAAIIGEAGRPGVITISTSMAGRGTDIKLAPGVAEKGGLAVIGTEWNESVRIDDQLRGRAGRQGDPGTSQFFVSLDDRVYKKFGKALLPALRERFDAAAALPALRDVRRKVEVENQAIRRDVFRYDLAVDEQRQQVYAWREDALKGGDRERLARIDELWTAHLSALEELEEGIGLRSYAEKDPVVEFRHEAAEMFRELCEKIEGGAEPAPPSEMD